MFPSLRTKLITTYVFLVVLAVLLAGGSAGVLISSAQRRENLVRTHALATSLAQRLHMQSGMRMGAPALLDRLRSESASVNGRILLLDAAGRVIADASSDSTGASPDSYVGQRVPVRPFAMPRPMMPASVWRHTFDDDQVYFLVVVPLTSRMERAAVRFLALVLPLEDVDLPWRSLFPRLLAVAAVVLVVAVALATLLANSVTRPIAQMTLAAEAMAMGDYDQ